MMDESGDSIHWQLHSSSIEMSAEDSNSHEIGSQALAALELSPISPPAAGSNRLFNVCSFSDTTTADKNPVSSTKSDSPGVESGKDYSSISSFSTLTSASKLPTEDIDFINFYFENNRRQTQLKENSACEIPVPIATRNRFLDCSPIPKLNFDETIVNLPSPDDTGCSHIRTSPASAESVLDDSELYKVVETNGGVGGFMDESEACAGSFLRPPAFLSAPVNSPNATTEMESNPSSSKLWYCHHPSEIDRLPTERSLGQGVTDILPESAAQKWKLDSRRPPCVGQEHSPESELNFPDTWRVMRNAVDECKDPNATADAVDSDIDLTEINPPSPVLKNSARKVGSWLQHLQEGEYSEEPAAVEVSLAVEAGTRKVIECVRSSDKCKCGAYNDYMNARRKQAGVFQDASVTTSPSKSMLPISSVVPHGNTVSGVARNPRTTTDSSLTAVVVPSIDSFQQHQNYDEKAKRHQYRKSRRSDGVKMRERCDLVRERKSQNMESSDGSCARRTTRNHQTAASNPSGVKYGHQAQESDCRESHVSSDDNTVCSRVEDAQMHKTLTKNHSSTVFFVGGHTLNPPRPTLKKSQMSSKRVLAKKLKAISLYMHHKKTYSHLDFKTLAIV